MVDEKATKILIVEDDKFLRELMVKKLNNEGFKVIEAQDGNEALKLVGESKPHLVLLDLILPGIDGFAVLEKMRATAENAKTPVIVLSNLGQKEEIEKGFKLGADDYLIKAHFTPGEIIEKIKKVLGSSYV